MSTLNIIVAPYQFILTHHAEISDKIYVLLNACIYICVCGCVRVYNMHVQDSSARSLMPVHPDPPYTAVCVPLKGSIRVGHKILFSFYCYYYNGRIRWTRDHRRNTVRIYVYTKRPYTSTLLVKLLFFNPRRRCVFFPRSLETILRICYVINVYVYEKKCTSTRNTVDRASFQTDYSATAAVIIIDIARYCKPLSARGSTASAHARPLK